MLAKVLKELLRYKSTCADSSRVPLIAMSRKYEKRGSLTHVFKELAMVLNQAETFSKPILQDKRLYSHKVCRALLHQV